MFETRYRDELEEPVSREFDGLMARLKAWMLREHNEDGTHIAQPARLDGASEQSGDAQENHHWKQGPWTFGELSQSNGLIGIRPPEIEPGTYNDFAPNNIDTAMIIELGLRTADITLTGLRQFENRKRLMVLGNLQSNAHSIILKHENTGSQAQNRFKLVGETDVTLSPGQFVWLYYDVGFSRWRCFITPQASGGLEIGNIEKTLLFPLTESQIENASGTPLTIIPQLGANKMAIVTGFAIFTSITTAYSTAPNWRLRYNGQTFELMTVVPSGLTTAGPASRTAVSIPSALQINQVLAPWTNTAVELSLSAAPGTPGTGVATAKAQIWYKVWDLS